MTTLFQDLRFAARMFVKNPMFTLIAVVTLALGIGANTAVFSVVNTVMLRPLAYAESDRILTVWDSMPTVGFPKIGMSEIEFVRLRTETRVFERAAAFSDGAATMLLNEPERLPVGYATVDFFSIFEVRPVEGRTFSTDEETLDRSRVVILGSELKTRLFGASSALGQVLTLNGRPHTVVGVLPADFRSPFELQQGTHLQAWLPYTFDLADLNKGSHNLNVFGRLRPGKTEQEAETEVGTIVGRIKRDIPDFYPQGTGNFRNFTTALHEEVVGRSRPLLLILLGAVTFVLLIACTNVANLLLARGETRQKEIALRATLGADRLRIVRQLLAESMFLSLIGACLGVGLASWGMQLFVKLNPGDLPRLQEIALDRRVLAFTMVTSLAAGIVSGLMPAFHALRFDLNTVLRESGRSATSGRGRRVARQALVVSEIALAFVLLVGAGLVLRSFNNMREVKLGFDPNRVLTLEVSPPVSAYPDGPSVVQFYERLLPEITNLPGVQSAAVAENLPLQGNGDTMMQIEGRPFDLAGLNLSTDFRIVTPAYFQTLGVRLVAGRLLTDADDGNAPPAVVINEAIVRNHFPNENPLGKHIRLLNAPPEKATTPFATVVGVVADAKNRALVEDPRQEMYVTLAQHMKVTSFPTRGAVVVVKATGDPLALAATVRQAIWSSDRTVPITRLRTMNQILDTVLVQPRFNTFLLGLFASLALGLGMVGIYGVVSYSVAQRTPEIGIRMALGANRRDVLQLVVRQGMVPAIIGVCLGAVAAFGLTRLMKSLLFEVSPTDWVTFGTIGLLLSGVALLACLIPARRATRTDPMAALRQE